MLRFTIAIPALFAVLLVLAQAAIADEGSSVTRIGMAGCHRQDNPSPSMYRYVQAGADLVIWMGDNVYADTEDDVTHIEHCYGLLGEHLAFQQMREKIPFAATWDDHDFGLNNMGKHYALKEQSKQLFREFWGMQEHIPADRDGIYHARYFGEGNQRLQVILLDGRYNRDDEGDRGDTLGENQWRWLEEELRMPARLRLIASGYQVFLDRDSKFETWSKFPTSQIRLFKLIQDTRAEGVVFLAGDQHYGEASRLPNALGYDAIELMFCGLNQEEPHVFSSTRVTPVAHAKNAYALIDIQWEESNTDLPHLVFRCFDADRDAAELTYRVNFDELKFPKP